MKKLFSGIFLLFFSCLLTGCNTIGSKGASISVVYLVAAIFSVVLLIGYCALLKTKDPWFVLLFSSVMVVNIGYWILSVSQTLDWALFANRLSYLGSVFLPFSMLMTIFRVTGAKHRKWLAWSLFGVAVLVFLIAASPGYWDVYYKSVSLKTVHGATALEKEYGPLHILYLVYLLGYFVAMTAVIIYSIKKKRLKSPIHAMILLSAVFINIGVWLLEQLVSVDFELLSVSYIISELFLLSLYLVMQENQRMLAAVKKATPKPAAEFTPCECPENFTDGMQRLTHAEKNIYRLYVSGKSSKEIMAELNITENTLKYHNKNLYSKLGVSSRKEMLEIARSYEKSVSS